MYMLIQPINFGQYIPIAVTSYTVQWNKLIHYYSQMMMYLVAATPYILCPNKRRYTLISRVFLFEMAPP